MRVGVIGSGFGAKVHVPGWRRVPGVEVRVLCGGRRERAEALAAQHGIPRATDDYRAVVAAADVDLVDVATHASLHREIALAALAAGKHVLCEKPIALTAADARELVDAAAAAGVVAAVGFQHRYLAPRRRFGELVAAGFLGEPRCVTVSVMDARGLDRSTPLGWWGPYALRAHGGGLLSQVLVHYLDFVCATFGELHDVRGTAATTVRRKPVAPEEPRTGAPLDLAAAAVELRAVDADDTVMLHARLGNGAPFALAGSWVAHHGGGARIEAHGSEATLVLDQGRLLAGRAGEPLAPVEVAGDAGGPPDMVGAFAWMAERIADAVRDGGRPPRAPAYPTFEDGLRVQEIVDAVLLSPESSSSNV